MVRSRAHIWFVAPAVILMVVILLVPVFVAATLSFTDYSLGDPDYEWVGWENYQALTKYSSYRKMFTASLAYVLIVVPISVALGLGAALLISSIRIGAGIGHRPD